MSYEFTDDDIRREFEELAGQVSDSDIRKTIAKSEDITHKVESSSLLKREIAKVRLLLMAIKDYWNEEYTEFPTRTVVAIVVALLYILNPLDLIPDVIPIIGQMDDLAMLMFVWSMISEDIREYAQWKIENSGQDREKVASLYREAFG